MTVASTLANPLVYTWWAMYSGPVIHKTSVTKATSLTASAVVWKLWAMCLARSRISDLPNAELPWPILMCASRPFFPDSGLVLALVVLQSDQEILVSSGIVGLPIQGLAG